MNNKIVASFFCFIITILPITAFASVEYSTRVDPVDSSMVSDIKSIDEDNYELIIITPKDFSIELQSLKNHKEQHGISTIIVTLEEIFDSTYFPLEGRDDAERIKYFLKNAKDNWNISYVLLIGGRVLIPCRKCNTMPLDDNFLNFTSELYYADIYNEYGNFSSWDSDGDGIYGEWYNGTKAEDNQQDLIPEIAVGRLACYNPSEVKRMVNKIIDYEKKPADSSWFRNMVVAGGETFIEYEGLEGEIMTQNALDVMSDFNPIKLWVSNGKLDFLGLSLLVAINRGCGFLYLAGHGDSRIWGTLRPNGKPAAFFSIFHMLFLFNKNKLPVCVVSGCHTNKIEKTDCWGWQMAKKPNGGSIATIGLTAIGHLGFQWGGGGVDWLELQFFKEYANGTMIIGDIWQNTLKKYLANYQIDWNLPAGLNCAIDAKMAQEWILIGDPSLKIGGYQ